MPETREVMTLQQAAEFLQISPRRMYDLAGSGEAPARKVGRLWRFTRRELLDWLDSDKTATKAP